jgi:REP element-mobilizing transposase RayT
MARQLALFKKRRKRGPKPGRAKGVLHLPRLEFQRRFPVHVTWRARRDVPRLYRTDMLRPLRRSFGAANGRFGMRVVHFAALGDHVHLIVEAEGKTSLTRGMQGLAIRAAKAINRAAGRKGRVFADRYHARVLRTPTETRNAVRYVLTNHEKHYGRDDKLAASSVWYPNEMERPRTWLLANVWTRAG